MAAPFPSARTRAFISYSHADAKYLADLKVHLATLTRDGKVDVWDDTRIAPGTLWFDEIKQAIRTAKVAIFLVSPNFLASDFIARQELPALLAAARQEGALVLSVILRPCLFKDTELARYQTVNPPTQPLSGLTEFEQDKVWVRMAELVGDALKAQSKPSPKHYPSQPAQPAYSPAPQTPQPPSQPSLVVQSPQAPPTWPGLVPQQSGAEAKKKAVIIRKAILALIFMLIALVGEVTGFFTYNLFDLLLILGIAIVAAILVANLAGQRTPGGMFGAFLFALIGIWIFLTFIPLVWHGDFLVPNTHIPLITSDIGAIFSIWVVHLLTQSFKKKE